MPPPPGYPRRTCRPCPGNSSSWKNWRAHSQPIAIRIAIGPQGCVPRSRFGLHWSVHARRSRSSMGAPQLNPLVEMNTDFFPVAASLSRLLCPFPGVPLLQPSHPTAQFFQVRIRRDAPLNFRQKQSARAESRYRSKFPLSPHMKYNGGSRLQGRPGCALPMCATSQSGDGIPSGTSLVDNLPRHECTDNMTTRTPSLVPKPG